MLRKIGLPSAVFWAFVVISMPFTSRPSTLLYLSVIGLTSDGYCIASCFISKS